MKLKGSDGGLEQQLSLAICAVYLRNNYFRIFQHITTCNPWILISTTVSYWCRQQIFENNPQFNKIIGLNNGNLNNLAQITTTIAAVILLLQYNHMLLVFLHVGEAFP